MSTAPSRLTIAGVVAMSIAGISISGPLVRLSNAEPLAIAIWRLGISVALIAAILVRNGQWRQWRSLDARAVALAVGGGVTLAVHFWTWIASIGLTTVAASVVLVDSQPAFVAAFSSLWLHERPTRGQVAGIAVAIVGAGIIAWPDLSAGMGAEIGGSRALLGDALALVGAVAGALYFTSGRSLRQRLDLWPFVGLVYSACFVALLICALVMRVRVAPQPPREIALFAAMALGPMMLGHTGMNWAVKYVPAYVVNVAWLGEPVGATLIAAFLPGIREVPGIATFAGGAVILLGLWQTTRRRT